MPTLGSSLGFALGVIILLLLPMGISLWLGEKSPFRHTLHLDHLHLLLGQLLIACLWSYTRLAVRSRPKPLAGRKRKAVGSEGRSELPREWQARLEQLGRDYVNLAQRSLEWPQIQTRSGSEAYEEDEAEQNVRFYAPLPSFEAESELKMEAGPLLGVSVATVVNLLWEQRCQVEPFWDRAIVRQQLGHGCRLLGLHSPGRWLVAAREVCLLERQQRLPDGSVLLLGCSISRNLEDASALPLHLTLQAALVEPMATGCRLTRWWTGIQMEGGFVSGGFFIRQLLEHLPLTLPRASNHLANRAASSQLALRLTRRITGEERKKKQSATPIQNSAMPNRLIGRGAHFQMLMSLLAPY